MTAKHTPGPWKADGNGIHKGMLCVALTHMAPKAQRDADARLIAAAPDLLEAAQAAWLCISELKATHVRVEVSNALQAAIEKATGEEA